MILEAIFNGEIYPAETVVPKSEKFREAGQAIADIMRYFEQTLSKEDYAKLDKLNDNFADRGTFQVWFYNGRSADERDIRTARL